jgi:hypothetical protein
MNNPPATFIKEEPWRIFRIMAEFVDAFEIFSKVGPSVTIFGSARTPPGDRYYKAAMTIAKGLARNNLAVITGGGPGIMEAANRGAQDAGGKTIGLNIGLPFEQRPNPFITPELCFEFHYFFMRKFWFAYLAKALVVFPGGFGTLDELTEILTLMQTQKLLKRMPIILYGAEFWKEIINFDALVKHGMIAESDLNLFSFADDVDTAFKELVSGLTKYWLDPGPEVPAIAKTQV